jgi:hypothetical protein
MNGDNVIFVYYNGKFHRTSNKVITSWEHNNFVITCIYGDWSGFRTLVECEKQFSELEYKRPDHYFEVVERL